MPSVRKQKNKRNQSNKVNLASEDYSKYSKYTKKKDEIISSTDKSKSKLIPVLVVMILAFSLISISGVFSPSDLSTDNNNEATLVEDNFDFQYTNLQATIYASETCDCCHLYAEYLEENGFIVNLVTDVNLAEIKAQYKLTSDYQSCHTTILNGYFIEGHIPLVAVSKLLDEKPDIDGISLPGMPSGSPGMPGPKSELFKIHSMVDGISIGLFGTI